MNNNLPLPLQDLVGRECDQINFSVERTALILETQWWVEASLGASVSVTRRGETLNNGMKGFRDALCSLINLSVVGVELDGGKLGLEFDDGSSVSIVANAAQDSWRLRGRDVEPFAPLVEP
jgi:hypothetical protein